VTTALGSIAGKFSLLLGELGTYAPPPADPRFNTLTQMESGEGYMIRMTQAATLVYPQLTALRALRTSAKSLAASGCADVQLTPYFSQYYGN